ncbi:unnamed protein product [Haemonchus placei]|uniref:Hcy-binding domain-containing protein n=1 Tax=Haemonchus placei TaxID=6290 RepID=A0A0N4WD19_HAEPC|nr:unnamed protein product [Haemonchus placei]
MWLDTARANACILVGPTCAVPPPKKEWCELASAIATAARNGMEILLIVIPSGDTAYDGMELNQAVELARKSVALMSRNIVSLIPMIECTCEPSHGQSVHRRNSDADVYSEETVIGYMQVLREYVKPEINLHRFVRTSTHRNQRVRNYLKAKRENRSGQEC